MLTKLLEKVRITRSKLEEISKSIIKEKSHNCEKKEKKRIDLNSVQEGKKP